MGVPFTAVCVPKDEERRTDRRVCVTMPTAAAGRGVSNRRQSARQPSGPVGWAELTKDQTHITFSRRIEPKIRVRQPSATHLRPHGRGEKAHSDIHLQAPTSRENTALPRIRLAASFRREGEHPRRARFPSVFPWTDSQSRLLWSWRFRDIKAAGQVEA
jgi:hypothetical protein